MVKIVVDTEREIYDVPEALIHLHISYATLFRWIKAGKLIPLRIGGRTLIPKSEVLRLGEQPPL